MKKVNIPPFVRTSNPSLSKWQSAVSKVARAHIVKDNPDLSTDQVNKLVIRHPMVLGTNHFVNEANGAGRTIDTEKVKKYLPKTGKKLNLHPVVHSYLSQTHFTQALAQVNSPEPQGGGAEPEGGGALSLFGGKPIQFPDSDYAYLAWAETAKIWATEGNPIPSPYVDVNDNGGPTSDFGVIEIPDNAKIVLLGDFGTGLNDATTMLIAIMEQVSPDIIIHIGDIYYSGTSDQCQAYVDTFATAFSRSGKTVPVFSLPGNHEYYSGGGPYFQKVITMNKNNGLAQYDQEASYFCLRTSNNNWQLLGMDTGYNSVHNFNIAHPTQMGAQYAPWLAFSEAAWHQDKLGKFSGKTILFSHHQLFSANAIINDGNGVVYQTGTNTESLDYLNGNLLSVFKPYFPNVAAWFWGHEHILNIFASNQLGLAKGRLVGNSGYEEWAGEDPYKPTTSPYTEVNPPVEVASTSVRWAGDSFNFLNHGFAVIQLSDPQNSSIDYFQYPVFTPGTAIPSTIPPIKKVNFKENLL